MILRADDNILTVTVVVLDLVVKMGKGWLEEPVLRR